MSEAPSVDHAARVPRADVPSGEFEVTHEPDRVSRAIVWSSAVLFVAFVFGSILVADGLMHGFAHGEPLHTAPPLRAEAEIGIVEQSLIRDSRRGLDTNDEQRRSLDQWGWVD